MEVRYLHNTRPWQYVVELIYGYLLLVKRFYNDDLGYGTLQFCSSKVTSAEDILNFSKVYWGENFNFKVSKNKSHIFEEQNLQISNKKIQTYIKWQNHKDL